MLHLTGLVVAASLAVGQTQGSPSQYENLKALDVLVGTWFYEGPLLEEWPGVAKKDDMVVVKLSYQWIFNKSVLETDLSIKFKDGPELAMKALTGWDPAKKQIVSGGIWSAGGYSLGVMTVSDDGKTIKSADKGVGPDGKETSGEGWTKIRGDTLTFQAKNRTGGGLPADSPEYTFKRQSK